jgi:hypothetical protein
MFVCPGEGGGGGWGRHDLPARCGSWQLQHIVHSPHGFALMPSEAEISDRKRVSPCQLAEATGSVNLVGCVEPARLEVWV